MPGLIRGQGSANLQVIHHDMWQNELIHPLSGPRFPFLIFQLLIQVNWVTGCAKSASIIWGDSLNVKAWTQFAKWKSCAHAQTFPAEMQLGFSAPTHWQQNESYGEAIDCCKTVQSNSAERGFSWLEKTRQAAQGCVQCLHSLVRNLRSLQKFLVSREQKNTHLQTTHEVLSWKRWNVKALF